MGSAAIASSCAGEPSNATLDLPHSRTLQVRPLGRHFGVLACSLGIRIILLIAFSADFGHQAPGALQLQEIPRPLRCRVRQKNGRGRERRRRQVDAAHGNAPARPEGPCPQIRPAEMHSPAIIRCCMLSAVATQVKLCGSPTWHEKKSGTEDPETRLLKKSKLNMRLLRRCSNEAFG